MDTLAFLDIQIVYPMQVQDPSTRSSDLEASLTRITKKQDAEQNSDDIALTAEADDIALTAEADDTPMEQFSLSKELETAEAWDVALPEISDAPLISDTNAAQADVEPADAQPAVQESAPAPESQASGQTRPQRSRRKNSSLARTLQLSSSAFAVAGGILVSSNTSVSKYGFIILSLSSAQFFASNFILRNQSLMIYAACLFIFVDILGIVRWVL